MTHPLASAWMKWHRAKEHLDQLIAEMRDFLALIDEGESYGASTNPDPETGDLVLRLRVDVPSPFMRWGAIVGDSIHNMRSALDHIIEAATTRHEGNPLPHIEFPIFDQEFGSNGRAGYREMQRKHPEKPDRRSGLHKVRGIDGRLRALVEGLQPYQRGDAAHGHPLWRIHEFDNIDKHRQVTIVGIATQIAGIRWGFEDFDLPLPAITNFLFPFEDGAEVARFRSDAPPREGPMDVHIGLTVDIRFGDGEPGFGDEPFPALSEMYQAVTLLLIFVTDVWEHLASPPLGG